MYYNTNNSTVVCVNNVTVNNIVLPAILPQQMPVQMNTNNVSFCMQMNTNMQVSFVDNQQMMCNVVNSLNPSAVEFVPVSPPSNEQSKYLAPIQEEREVRACNRYQQWQCNSMHSSQDIVNLLKCKYIIYIPTQITKSAVDYHLFAEHFATDCDLFYYLRYQCRIQVIDKLYRFYSCYDQQLVIFNTELHARNKSELFIVGKPNDKGKNNAVKWKMIRFMTADEIYEIYNIPCDVLPRGSRVQLHDKIKAQMTKYKRAVSSCINSMQSNMDTMRSMNKIGQIKSEMNDSPLIVTFEELFQGMRDSIKLNELRPIVWFSNNKQNPTYRIQMVLPIELAYGNCIGVTFDYDDQHKMHPVKFCIDDVDMRRKLTLFKPSTDENEYRLFSNNISEIYITNDSAQQLIWKQNERIKSLEKMMRDKENEIAQLKGLLSNV